MALGPSSETSCSDAHRAVTTPGHRLARSARSMSYIRGRSDTCRAVGDSGSDRSRSISATISMVSSSAGKSISSASSASVTSLGVPNTVRVFRNETVPKTDGMGYWESPQLKAGLSRHYRQTYGLEVDPDRFVLTCGASPALLLALAANFNAGARVAIARPGYPAFRNTLQALNLAPLEVPCDARTRYQLTADHLEALQPAPEGVIVASPANPTGALIDGPKLARIAEVCRERGIL